jgi:hypothetical protein
MSSIDQALAKIIRLVSTVQPVQAQEQALQLIEGLGHAQLVEHRVRIEEMIAAFLPKRRRLLTQAFLTQLEAPVAVKRDSEVSRSAALDWISDLRAFTRSELAQLGEQHIFQWSTFYRDSIGKIYDRARECPDPTIVGQLLSEVLASEFARHAEDIFGRGYAFVTASSSVASATEKSLGGLQRFTALPVEKYSATRLGLTSASEARMARLVCSAILAGILRGYGNVSYHDASGWQLLPRYPRSWAHYLPFLTLSDLDSVISELDLGALRSGLTSTVIPIVKSIDELIEDDSQHLLAMPGLSVFYWPARRLELSIFQNCATDRRNYIEVHCYIDPSYVTRELLRESSNKGVSLIAAPIRPDLQELVDKDESLRACTINTTPQGGSTDSVGLRTRNVLADELSRLSGSYSRANSITYNYAAEFPLRNPWCAKTYYFVQRLSVRALLRTFESQSGVRLWCSVRRSGKTTSCFDLGSSTGKTTVISQTCAQTEVYPADTVFYDHVVDALAAEDRISRTFFRDLVARCGQADLKDLRFTFVLDEYETLFGDMSSAITRNPSLRYMVVQPLMDQMVAFSRDNLLVFVGQRPDAHFIIMDQNQLSPCVVQDQFPLFEHAEGSHSSEFGQLIQKVITPRVEFDTPFADALFSETGGHPYLTVNLLVVFFNWLISTKRRIDGLQLSAADYYDFAAEGFARDELIENEQYLVFRQFIGSMLGHKGRDRDPWLYTVLAAMREMTRNSATRIAVSRSDFSQIVERVRPDSSYDAIELLNMAQRANFLCSSRKEVWPRIPIMARLCAAVSPATEP